ncbi:MAG: hypothetical protein WD424_02025 [Paenibacillaceae bacterium]
MRKTWIALIFMVLIGTTGWFAPQPAYACSCAESDFEPASERASEVFHGKVVAVELSLDPHEALGTIGRRNAVLFKVERSYKHSRPSQIIVYAGYGESSCGYDFTVGQQYLVYVHTLYGNELHTSLCSRTQSIEEANNDLMKLGEGWLPNENVDLRSELKETWVDTALFHIQRFTKMLLTSEGLALTIMALSLLVILLGIGTRLRGKDVIVRLAQWTGGIAAVVAIILSITIIFFNPYSDRVNLTELILTVSLLFLPACLALLSVWRKSALWMFVSFLWALPLGFVLVATTSIFSVAALSVYLYFVSAVWFFMAMNGKSVG